MTETEYLLICLSEELAEVQQEISKCLRFTPNHRPPQYSTTNIERVRLEIADVYAIVKMLHNQGVDAGIYIPPASEIPLDQLYRMEDKICRTKRLFEVSEKLGVLNACAD